MQGINNGYRYLYHNVLTKKITRFKTYIIFYYFVVYVSKTKLNICYNNMNKH